MNRRGWLGALTSALGNGALRRFLPARTPGVVPYAERTMVIKEDVTTNSNDWNPGYSTVGTVLRRTIFGPDVGAVEYELRISQYERDGRGLLGPLYEAYVTHDIVAFPMRQDPGWAIGDFLVKGKDGSWGRLSSQT